MALVSVVVPIYYEAESLTSLADRLSALAAATARHEFEFIYVDDGYGDGGMLVTNNEGIANKVKMLGNYGQKEKYHHLFIAYNRRLDSLQDSQHYGKDLEPETRGEFRPGDVRHIVADISQIRPLGFEPRYSLEEGLQRYIEWLESQGNVKEYFSEAERVLKEAGIVRLAKAEEV